LFGCVDIVAIDLRQPAIVAAQTTSLGHVEDAKRAKICLRRRKSVSFGLKHRNHNARKMPSESLTGSRLGVAGK
jgi:hypothetical protein